MKLQKIWIWWQKKQNFKNSTYLDNQQGQLGCEVVVGPGNKSFFVFGPSCSLHVQIVHFYSSQAAWFWQKHYTCLPVLPVALSLSSRTPGALCLMCLFVFMKNFTVMVVLVMISTPLVHMHSCSTLTNSLYYLRAGFELRLLLILKKISKSPGAYSGTKRQRISHE